MHLSSVVLLIAASSVKATAVLAERAPVSNLIARDIAQGWSVQASSAPAGTTSCGSGSYCPSSLHCGPAANDEVPACCTSATDCRGDVEGAPKCADSTWSLWVGYDGNGFCCETGLVGAYDTSKSVAGTCVSSVGSLRSAVLTSSGSGAAATTSSSASASAAASTTSTSSAAAATTTSSGSSVSSTKSESSKTSSEASVKSSSTSSTSGTATAASTSGSSSTGSSTASSATPTASGSSGEKIGMGFGLMGAAFLAAAAL